MTHNRFVSNKLEELLEELKLQLLNANPFVSKIIVVPSQRIKTWIQEKLTEDERFGVAMGLRFLGLMPAMEQLANRSLFINESALALNIEGEIDQILHSNRLPEMQPLLEYVKPGNRDKRIRQLADHLARSFVVMARYGGVFLKTWLNRSGWRQEIWKKTLKTNSYEEFELTEPCCDHLDVHLFAIPSIPSIYLRFLDHYRGCLSYYILSPCQVFWGDIVSEKMRLAILKDDQNLVMDQFLTDRNPLLANWGCKLYFKQLEDGTNIESYQRSPKPLLLHQIQNAILDSDSKTSFVKDDSLCVHSAYNRQREIEILKDAIIHLTQQQQIDPTNILVLAPNINDYVPFIQKVFSDEGAFNFAIEDISSVRDSLLLKAVVGLVDLAKSRMTLSDVLEFFSNSCVKKKCQISSEDLGLIERWGKQCGVCFGLDAKHRHELLALPGVADTMLESTSRGTWEFAFDGLLAGLAILPNENEPEELLPIVFVENATAESLGKWIRLLKSIRWENQKRSIDEWKRWFQDWVLNFIDTSEDERGYEDFIEALDSLTALENHSFTFDSFWERLLAKLEGRTHAIGGHDLNAIRFCSLKTGRAHPASLIWCLGLHDRAFPRMPLANPLDEMGQQGDRYPTHADEDRHLFLELLISARDAFYISYISHAASDGKLQGPSSLIEELMDYIELDIIYHHPELAFDPEYFSSQTPWPSYDLNHYAILSEDSNRVIPHLIPQFFGQKIELPHVDEQVNIQVSDLVSFGKNPLAHFLKKQIGIYLEYEEEDKEFHLSALHRFLIHKHFLHTEESDVIQIHRKSGQFPLGRFGEITKRKLQTYQNHLSEKLDGFGLDFSDLFSLQLDKSDVKRFYTAEDVLGLQALPLLLSNGKKVVIHGHLNHVSTEGPLIQAKSNLVGKVRNWPAILIPIVLDLCKPQALFLEDGKAVEVFDAEKALKKYIEYYLRSLSDPSPLIAPWINSLLDEAKKPFQKVTDPYAIWALNDDKAVADAIMQRWTEELTRVFDGNI